VIIVDNSEEDRFELVKQIVPATYLREGKVTLARQDFPCLFEAREAAARLARGDYLFCVDSHCLIGHGTIRALVHFMNRNKSRPLGFAHAPVNWLCQHERASRHDMRGFYGTWGGLYQREQRISWKGMPWMCRRKWFLGALGGYGFLAAKRVSWGGGDMYLGLKSWLLGYENWAVPTRSVIHIGPLPKAVRQDGYTYRLYGKSGDTPNYIGFLGAYYALGIEQHRTEQFERFLETRFSLTLDDETRRLAMDLAQEDRNWICDRVQRTIVQAEKLWADAGYLRHLARFKQRVGETRRCIKEEDWKVIQEWIGDAETVLEFGCGLSTVLFAEQGHQVMSIEWDSDYMHKVRELVSAPGRVDFALWDERTLADRYDLALVDGVTPRREQMIEAAARTRLVLVHDGYTPPDRAAANDVFKSWKEIPVSSRRMRLFLKGD
jgi:hypothetical protein